MRDFLLLCIAGGLIPALVSAQCAPDHRSNKSGGIQLKDLNLVGPKTLTSDQLAAISGELAGGCFDEDSDELQERIRALFQDRGYFTVEVKSLQLKPQDPLAVPKPVLAEAEVAEGPRYKVGEITFVKNHAFSAERLRQEFPMKAGEWFARGKVATGLEALRKLYGSSGFLDYVAIPETEFGSNATANLSLSFEEGPQYHLQKVEILAKKDLAAKLRMQWKLEEGAVYDHDYLDRYIDENRHLLPEGFREEQVQVVRDCPGALVDVRLAIDASEDTSKSAPKDVPCETNDKKDSSKAKGGEQ